MLNRFLRRLQRAGVPLPAPWLVPAGLTAGLWLKGLHPGLPGWPCPLRALTGVPCPTCFLTRATSSALVGQLGEAITWHAFGPLVAAGLLGWSLVAIRQRRLWPRSFPAWPLALGTIALLGYWLLRLLLSFGLGMAGFPAFPAG